MVVTILLFLIIFGVIVIGHEFGHFLLGKANGIGVVEFSVGMGPKLISFTKGGTLYSLRLFPIGGACMFAGEDGSDTAGTEQLGKSFSEAGVWSRISAVLAGPMFNFILAFVFALMVTNYAGIDLPIVTGMMEGYPAEEAGLQPGDEITEIDGSRVHFYRDITTTTMLNRGEAIQVEYKRDGQQYQTVIQPKYSEADGRYLMGLTSANGLKYAEGKGWNLVKYSFHEVGYVLKLTYKSLLMLFQGQAKVSDLAGPVGMAQIVGDTYESSKSYGAVAVLMNMINLALLLSVNIGFLNLLPLPALDGGRLVFLLIEVVRGKPVPPEKEGMVHFAGFVALMLLMVFVMYNDIVRLITK